MPKRNRQNDEEEKSPNITRKGHNYLHTLALEATGCFAGTPLIGTRPRTQNARIVVDKDVKPFKNTHDAIKALGQWPKFIELVFQLPGFNRFKNKEEVASWLDANVSESGNLASVGDEGQEQGLISVQNLGVEPSQFLLLPSNFDFAQNYRCDELEDMIPRPDTTKSFKKHTLFLHRSGFQIFTPSQELFKVPSNKHVCFYDVDEDQYLTEIPNKKALMITDNLCVFYQCGVQQEIKNLVDFNLEQKIPNDILHCLTAGEMRSCLQKIIRFNPQTILFENAIQVNALQVLRSLILKAVVHPGGFVPNLQCHERGLPSMLKRLAVTSVEDSFVSGELIHRLLVMSAVAFKDEEYYPCPISIQRLLKDVDALYNSPMAVEYNCQRGSGYTLVAKYDAKKHVLFRASFLLDQLKAFAWDLTMFRDIAYNCETLTFAEGFKRPEEMNFEWFLDHHVKPHVAYYMCRDMADYVAKQLVNARDEVFGDFKAQPFAKFFKIMFQKGTGFNYRRTLLCDFEKDIFPKWLITGQQFFWQVTQGRFPQFHSVPKPTSYVYTIDKLFLASCIGQHKFAINGKQYFAFISQMEPQLRMDAIRVPSRGQKSADIDVEDQKTAIEMLIKKLTQGFRIHNTIFGKQKLIVLEKNELVMQGVENIFDIQVELQFDMNDLRSHFAQIPKPHLQRFWQLTGNHSARLIFPKITRNGGPDDEPVNYLDIYVFQFCLQLCKLFPFFITLTAEREFTFTNLLGWLKIREDILRPLIMITHNNENNMESKWEFHEDVQEREFKKEQQQAFECFCNRHMNGERANIYIAPCGSGKTMTVLNYIKYLSDMGDLPNYVLWVGPKDSLDGTMTEVQQFTKNVIVLNGCKKKSILQKKIPMFTIVLIDVDHLKMMPDIINDVLPQSFVVLDEFHLALCKKTQRTANVRRLTAISHSFLALSGTPVNNNDVYEMIPMLKQIVGFEVRCDNFFIAYAACVNQGSVSTRIKIVDLVEEVPMPITRNDYWSLLPLMLGGNNKQKLQGKDLMNLLTMAQSECDGKMIDLTLKYVEKGHVVFLVANNAEHAQYLFDLLTSFQKDVYLIKEAKQTINLTTVTIANSRDSKIRRYDVVISPMRVCMGYNLSISDVMISSVYCSNAAKRTQIRQRINRLSSTFELLTYVTVQCGISKLIAQKQDVHDSFAKILDDLNIAR